MKLYIILRLNEYASDGYDFDVMVENRWKMYEDDKDLCLITTIDIDINDHSSKLVWKQNLKWLKSFNLNFC